MSALATPVRARVRERLDEIPHAGAILGLAAILAASLLLRTQAITAKFWIDEGLSVGIAHHPLWDIPGLLRQDGSPPLYYMLLHLWMGVSDGDGEARTHTLSLLFACAMVPAGWWAGRRLFGDRAGWATAALCATCPFLTYYAQETRMYSLLALLSLVSSAAFGLAYGVRDRRALPAFAAATALMLYTHNWGLFLAGGFVIAWATLVRMAPDGERRGLVRDGLLGFGGVALLYLPWVPTLLSQARHTGAPWAERPALDGLITGSQVLGGGESTALAVALIGGAGLLTLRRGREGRATARAALAIFVAGTAAILLAWLASQASPAWTTRYFAAFLGPALLLAGAGLVRYGKLGLVALAIVLALWFDPRERQIKGKSDVYRVARTLQDQGLVSPRDLVVSTHPEQTPVMRYYLGPGYRYADALGPVPDTQIFDWRDALDRLRATGPVATMRVLAPKVAPGQRLVLIQPIVRTGGWAAPWTRLVRRRAAQWERTLDHDPRFQRVAPVPEFGRRPLPRGVRAVVYLRR